MVYGFAKMGRAVIGDRERAAIYTYTKACGRYRDAPSVVSTKLPLVKLPVNDILDPVSLHFAKNAFHVL